MLPLAVVTAGFVVLVVASKRRRRSRAEVGEPLAPPSEAVILVPRPEPDEASMPRWRRPSLMEARRANPGHSGERAPVRFDDAIESADRLVVRYDLARLTDTPDEASGRELGIVGRGDEVLVLEKHGPYRRVRTPDGVEGWIHRTALAAIELTTSLEEAMNALDEVARSVPPVKRQRKPKSPSAVPDRPLRTARARPRLLPEP